MSTNSEWVPQHPLISTLLWLFGQPNDAGSNSALNASIIAAKNSDGPTSRIPMNNNQNSGLTSSLSCDSDSTTKPNSDSQNEKNVSTTEEGLLLDIDSKDRAPLKTPQSPQWGWFSGTTPTPPQEQYAKQDH